MCMLPGVASVELFTRTSFFATRAIPTFRMGYLKIIINMIKISETPCLLRYRRRGKKKARLHFFSWEKIDLS